MLSRGEFGYQIRKLREDKGLSQMELARLVKMKRSTLGDTETGERYPTLHETVALARYFGLRIDRFISGELEGKKLRSPIQRFVNN